MFWSSETLTSSFRVALEFFATCSLETGLLSGFVHHGVRFLGCWVHSLGDLSENLSTAKIGELVIEVSLECYCPLDAPCLQDYDYSPCLHHDVPRPLSRWFITSLPWRSCSQPWPMNTFSAFVMICIGCSMLSGCGTRNAFSKSSLEVTRNVSWSMMCLWVDVSFLLEDHSFLLTLHIDTPKNFKKRSSKFLCISLASHYIFNTFPVPRFRNFRISSL